jgi:hypothetical protein
MGQASESSFSSASSVAVKRTVIRPGGERNPGWEIRGTCFLKSAAVAVSARLPATVEQKVTRLGPVTVSCYSPKSAGYLTTTLVSPALPALS